VSCRTPWPISSVETGWSYNQFDSLKMSGKAMSDHAQEGPQGEAVRESYLLKELQVVVSQGLILKFRLYVVCC